VSLNAATIELLLSKGLTGEDLLEIARSVEACQPKSPAAVRAARYRMRGGGKIPEDMRQAVFERDGFACLDCGSDQYLQCDHVHPVSQGGETSMENLQTLCRVCNARKRDRIRKRTSKGQSEGGSAGQSSGNSVGNSAGSSKDSPPKEYISNPRPVSNETEPVLAAQSKSQRGSRLSDDFEPPEDWIVWAMKKRGWCRDEAIDECECFIRYWQAKPGREACKLDWPKTWQNWAVNSRRRSDARPQPAVPL
jgi:hypothetical protein